MTYTIYGDLGSGAFSAEAALAETGAEYEFHTISLEKNEQKAPEFLAINPSGKMPALKLPEGGIVTESAAILFILAERFPDAGLLPPPGSFARAQAMRWIVFLASEAYPMVEISDYPARFVPEGGEAADIYAAMFTRWRNSIGREWLAAGHIPKVLALAEGVSQRPKIAPVWKRHFPRG